MNDIYKDGTSLVNHPTWISYRVTRLGGVGACEHGCEADGVHLSGQKD